MSDSDSEFLKRLLATFKVEAQEHVQQICAGLLELEQAAAPESAPIIEIVFREIHSLKGAARAVNLKDVEALCQTMESVFANLRKGSVQTSSTLFDLLQQALDVLNQLLFSADGEKTAQSRTLARAMIAKLSAANKRSVPAPVEQKVAEVVPEVASNKQQCATSAQPLPAVTAQQPLKTDTVRVATPKLSSLLLQSEEMLSAKLAANQHALDLRTLSASFGEWKKEWTKILPLAQELRSITRKMAVADDGGARPNFAPRDLDRILDFFDWNEHFITNLKERYSAETMVIERDGRTLAGMVDNLLDDMKKVLMFPFSSLLEILPKLVRDLAHSNNKRIELRLDGGEIEIDRRILEEMKDPLIHLVRNGIDHGIESPAVRLEKNKPESGSITVSVSPKDNKVELVVADDGRGISLDGVRAALLNSGSVTAAKVAELSEHELLAAVFKSGLSTSAIITEISGRGLGLAIVREKVEKLGGSVNIETKVDKGTRFLITLPLTVATFRGLLVVSEDQEFVIPTIYVELVLRLAQREIKSVENRETISLAGKPVAVVWLGRVLELSGHKKPLQEDEFLQMVVLNVAGTRIAFIVDQVQVEQEVLFKRLGPQLTRVRNISGATVLGSGRVVPVLNVPDLLKSAVRKSSSMGNDRALARGDSVDSAARVLIAEDSITTRILLKNILETSGFQVVTAVDGMDAFTKLKGATFDILVSDVEMPRLNGFELTAKVRGEKSLENLPVVLVTALASPQDRERGIDAGANAYIVKSSFDQSNLLDVVRRLL